MLPHRSIRSLYPLALAEGEGLGTAYEYFVKRLNLDKRLDDCPPNPRILIAGLPEKYGSSLDFVLLAGELKARELIVIDDRPAALEKCRDNIEQARKSEHSVPASIRYQSVGRMATFEEVSGTFDFCVSCEVLQRLGSADRRSYLERILSISPIAAVFAPNGNNLQHRTKSGLTGVTMEDLESLADGLGRIDTAGYIDLPPWPPGLVLSSSQRGQLAGGGPHSVAMSVVEACAHLERILPAAWRKRYAHIVWMLARRA